MSEKIVVTLEVDTKTGVSNVKKMEKEVANAGDAAKKTGGELDGLTKKLDGISGGAVTAFKNFSQGAQSGIKAMNGLRVAIAATGIGLLVIGILAVKAAFEGSEEGQNKFAKIMGVINAVVGNFVDILANIGELIIGVFENPKQAINDFANLLRDQIINRFNGLLELIPELAKAVKLLFKGEFTEAGRVALDAAGKVTLGIEGTTAAIKAATEATKEFIDEQIREGRLAAEVADKRAKADKLERELIVERAELESKIADLKLKARKEDEFTAAQRREFILEAQELEDSLLKKETEVLELRRDAIQTENEFARSNKQNLDDQAAAEAEVLRQQARRLDNQRATQRELNRLTKEAGAVAAAASKERIEAIEAINAALRSQQEQEIFEVNKKFDALVKQAEKFGGDTVALEEKRQEALQAIRDKEIEEQRKRDEALALEAQQAAEREAQAREQIAAVFRSTLEQEVMAERLKYEQLIALAEEYGEDVTALRRRQAESIAAIEERAARESAEAQRAIDFETAQTKLAVASDLGNSVSELLGRETEAGKAAAVATATINTYAGASKALAVYGPTPVGFAALAASIATGLLQVRNILAVQVPGGGGGGGSAPSFAAPQAPQLGSSIGLINPNEQGGQIGDSLAQGLSERPMKAYVTAGEVISGTDLENRIRANGQFE